MAPAEIDLRSDPAFPDHGYVFESYDPARPGEVVLHVGPLLLRMTEAQAGAARYYFENT